MTSMIEPTIDQSLMIAHRHAPVGDVAHGLLTALRRVRVAVEDVGGYAMVSMLDGAIRDRLIIRRLRQDWPAGGAVAAAAMPCPGAHSPIADMILINAAETCLIYAAQHADTSELLLTVFVLLDRLIETLHSAIDCGDLLAWLRAEDDKADALIGTGIETHGAAISIH
ncbi:MAG TPA: hypothetical protein VM689_07395 [Aliidongia sp.]|nr:hypothetical protein [Aliidongia sp.]